MVPKKSVGSGDGKEETSVKAIADTEMEGGANKRWLRVSRLGDWEKAADAINRNTETRERSWTLKKKKKKMTAFFTDWVWSDDKSFRWRYRVGNQFWRNSAPFNK